MNGFTSAILTMLLSWLRSLVNNLWRLLGSEGGNSFISFMRTNWKMVFAIVCVGGFVVDRMIYLIRWRPYYVWSTKLGRLKHRRRGREANEAAAYAPDHSKPHSTAFTQDEAPYSLPQAQILQETFTSPSTVVNTPNIQHDEMGHTLGYAPIASTRNFASATEATISYSHMSSGTEPAMEPIFDEDSVAWTTPLRGQIHKPYSLLYAEDSLEFAEPPQEPFEHPAMNLAPAFGMSKAEPAQYLMDVQAGFAPPPMPEALYPQHSPTAKSEPVHPGLDLETFQQNIGLTPCTSETNRPTEPLLRPAIDFPNTTFVSYYQNGEQDTTNRSRHALSGFAKKARSLVSMHDEANPPSIRDLQPTMDIKDAFHAPVFPRKSDESGAEL